MAQCKKRVHGDKGLQPWGISSKAHSIMKPSDGSDGVCSTVQPDQEEKALGNRLMFHFTASHVTFLLLFPAHTASHGQLCSMVVL